MAIRPLVRTALSSCRDTAVWPHLSIQAYLHRADLPRERVDAEELGATLLQDGIPQCCIVCLWIIRIRGLSPGHIGACEGQGHVGAMPRGASLQLQGALPAPLQHATVPVPGPRSACAHTNVPASWLVLLVREEVGCPVHTVDTCLPQDPKTDQASSLGTSPWGGSW